VRIRVRVRLRVRVTVRERVTVRVWVRLRLRLRVGVRVRVRALERHACILDREPVVLHLGVAEGAIAVVGGHLGVEVDRLVVLLQRVREVRLLEQLIALVLNRLPHATALSHQPPAIRPQRSESAWA